MTLALYRYASLLILATSLLAGAWWHGYSTANVRLKAAQQAAKDEALRQAKLVDNLRAEADTLRARRPAVRERLVEVAKRVEVPADCRLPAALRVLWDVSPGDLSPTRTSKRNHGPLPAVAENGR